jgi:hypothetical protein
MKTFVIIDKSSKTFPYIATYVAYSNELAPVPVSPLSRARLWEVNDSTESRYDDADVMLNFYKDHKLQGKDWEIREVSITTIGEPIQLPW